MKWKWIAILILLFSWLGIAGCSQVKWSLNTGEVKLVAESYDKAGAETFKSETAFKAIDHKTSMHPWKIVQDIGGGALDTLIWLGAKMGIG